MESTKNIKAVGEVLEMGDEDTTLLSASEAVRRKGGNASSSVFP